METTVKLYSLDYSNLKTYVAASFFIMGNLALPQLCHLLPQGGMIWLPIYFFTLIGAYKYGWKVGIVTAIVSPVVNSLLFGMPIPMILPAIILKSVLLAIAAGLAAWQFKSISLLALFVVVMTYQIIGTLGEWVLLGNIHSAIQDFRIGLPGMAFQIIGGWLFIKYLINK